MESKRLRVLGIGIVIFLLLFMLLYIGKYQLEDSYKLLPGDVETEKIEQDTGAWREFNSRISHFRAYFPTMPTQDTTRIAIPDEEDKEAALDIYLSNLPDGSFLMVRVIRYPEDYKVKDVEEALRKTMGDLVNLDERNILRDVHDTTFHERQAIDFSIENPDTRIEATSIYSNNSIYTLIYAARPQVYEPAVLEHFKERFVLTTDFDSPPTL
jgi:hypothetical protein